MKNWLSQVLSAINQVPGVSTNQWNAKKINPVILFWEAWNVLIYLMYIAAATLIKYKHSIYFPVDQFTDICWDTRDLNYIL